MSNCTKKIMASITLFFIIIFTSLVFNYIIPFLPNNRTLQLLDLSTSNSVKLRHDFTEQALHTIYTNPIFGDFGSYIYGESAHNILAVWVDFGLFGFQNLIPSLASYLNKKKKALFYACSGGLAGIIGSIVFYSLYSILFMTILGMFGGIIHFVTLVLLKKLIK